MLPSPAVHCLITNQAGASAPVRACLHALGMAPRPSQAELALPGRPVRLHQTCDCAVVLECNMQVHSTQGRLTTKHRDVVAGLPQQHMPDAGL